jgi:hypothetical protein
VAVGDVNQRTADPGGRLRSCLDARRPAIHLAPALPASAAPPRALVGQRCRPAQHRSTCTLRRCVSRG